MKITFKINYYLASTALMFFFSSINLSASTENSYLIADSSPYIFNTTSGTIFFTALNNGEENGSSVKSGDSKNDSSINWHKILGWSTLGMMAVTISSGFIIPEKGHCALAGVTTGLAAVTCADGIYEYGGLISFTDGDWKYNTHAIMGVLATAGFITTLALADGDAHKVSGIASGAAFSVALGIIYF